MIRKKGTWLRVDSVTKERSFSVTRMLLVGQFRDEMIISCKVDLSTRRESNSHLKVPIFQGLCGGSRAHGAASNQRFAPIATQNSARRNLFSLGIVLP